MYKIGIISDTHGLLREDVIDILKTCDAIIHSGDFNTPSLLEQLKTLAPIYAVRGNTDRAWAANLPQTLSVELCGIRFFIIHDKQMIQEDIHDKDIIIFGHSHKYEQQTVNGQTWLNPGSCGPKRFLLPASMAVIQAEADGTYQIERIDLADLSFAETPIYADKKTGLPQQTDPFSLKAGKKYIPPHGNMKRIIRRVMKETDKGTPVLTIAKRCRIDEALAERICRLYLTHPGVSIEGIMTKMGL